MLIQHVGTFPCFNCKYAVRQGNVSCTRVNIVFLQPILDGLQNGISLLVENLAGGVGCDDGTGWKRSRY